MDAHTLSAAQGTSTAATLSEENQAINPELLGNIRAELGGRTLERLELECRELVQTTAIIAIEIGKRLLLIKYAVGHSDFMPALSRIGISYESAKKMMRACIRFMSLPDSSKLLEAAKSKTKLFELMSLDDDELLALSQGEAVRGVSLTSLPNTSVVSLRSMLKGERELREKELKELKNSAAAVLSAKDRLRNPKIVDVDDFPESIPPLPPSGDAVLSETFPKRATSHVLDPLPPSDMPQLIAGNRVKSIHAGRTGQVVKAYADGSACVLWDDGEPQGEGLGHERMPRQLLELDESNHEAEETSAIAESPDDYPAVYALLPGDLNGRPVSLVRHEGKTWMIAEEIAAILGDSPESVKHIDGVISFVIDKNIPQGHYAKVRLASTPLVVSLLDGTAIDLLSIHPGTGSAEALAAWLDASGKPAEVVNLKREKPLDKSLDLLTDQFYATQKIMFKISAQVQAIRHIAETAENGSVAIRNAQIADLAEIAADVIAPFESMLDDIDDNVSAIKRRIFTAPQAVSRLPECEWLKLLFAVMVNFNVDLSADAASDLSGIANSFNAYAASSPEVETAFKLLKSFAEERGAMLHDHPYPGNFAYQWLPGREPHNRRAPEMAN